MAKALVEAFEQSWNDNIALHNDIKIVSPPAVQPTGSCSTLHAAVGHYEFRDGARFRIRYSVDTRDNATMILVEDDVGLRPGFLNDINAYLLEVSCEPDNEPPRLVSLALRKACRMHTRASTVSPSSSASLPTSVSSLARRSGASAAFKIEDHPLAAMLASKRAESRLHRRNSTAGDNDPATADSEGGAEKKRVENPLTSKAPHSHRFGSSSHASTTLMKQLKILESQDTRADGFEAWPKEDDLYTWHVKLYFDDGTSSLSRDLAKLDNVDHLDLEFKFPSSYPSEPPVVRFLAPSIQGGHVTSHGAICMELLTGSGWSPVNSIDAVCIQIRALLVAGNARVDVNRPCNVARYTLEGALQDLSSIVFSHGWTVQGAKTAKRPRSSNHGNPL